MDKENPEKSIWANITKLLLENTMNQEMYNKFKPQDIVTRNKYVDWNGLGILYAYTVQGHKEVIGMQARRREKKGDLD